MEQRCQATTVGSLTRNVLVSALSASNMRSQEVFSPHTRG
ncbi:Protein of unknown function [Propionibacterium freudenreichii]|nr:Protein of unknown function [Propionibacterium freudenreichii]CEI24246.1 Protein of unknown function [Propionibacterium freudenreichii]CEI48116.1 Protein of unknown function [Propionibacterium freudenreichii]